MRHLQLLVLSSLFLSGHSYAREIRDSDAPMSKMTRSKKSIVVENLDKNLGTFPHERTDTIKKSNANIGRYMYVGSAPQFSGDELELDVSKMSLTLRVTGWVTQSRIDGFAKELYQKWVKIDDALNDPNFVIHPLVKIETLATKESSQAWAKIAAQYSSHVLDNQGTEIYHSKRNAQSLQDDGIEDEYKDKIRNAVLKYYFNDNTLNANDIKNDNQLRDRMLSVSNSRSLFNIHHGLRFTQTQERAGYLGFLTLVYPIAATVDGPFSQPAEGHKTLMNYGSINARWWSDKWNDEFGGLPFILIEKSGVAFHGPITNFGPLDVWYLRRGYVSHGCHRMDTSDVIELRSILPTKISELGKVKITIKNYFDVTDWDRDGKEEVVDVKYYSIPSSISISKGKVVDEVIKPYLVENQMRTFLSNHTYAKKFYNAETRTIQNAPKYKLQNGVLIKDGTHPSLPIMSFEYQKNRIIQYKELGTQLYPYDDNRGKYPPIYFMD